MPLKPMQLKQMSLKQKLLQPVREVKTNIEAEKKLKNVERN